MPGVPKSRACDACRQRRKRCDQVQPTCSRCQKLRLQCVGGGRQRFIFKTYNSSHVGKSSPPEQSIMQVPPSPDMAVSMSLVNKLQNRQSRFEINWAHGSFMDDIPKRTSHSVALTAATQAFMLALPCAEVSHTLSLRRLRSYTAALRATRLALLHPAEAYTLNTLCAVYLLWICQSWTAIEDDTFVHQKGIASLLNQNLRFDATNQFDRGVIYVACTVVIQQKMILGKADIQPDCPCWSFFRKVNAQSATVDFVGSTGESLALVKRLSRLLLAVGKFFRSDQALSDVWRLYDIATGVVTDLSREIQAVKDTTSRALITGSDADYNSRPEIIEASNHGMRAFKFALTLTLIMNHTLSVHNPQSVSLMEFRRQHTKEVLPISTKSEKIAPMGVGFMGVFLSHVWEIENETTSHRAAWDMYGKEEARKRSSTFSAKLEGSLESLL